MAVKIRAVLLVLAIAALWSTWAEKARFDNYRVISVRVENDKQRRLLEDIEGNTDSVQFLKPPSLHHNAEMIVAPHKLADIDELFRRNSIHSEVLIRNLQKYACEPHLSTDYWMGYTIYFHTGSSTTNNRKPGRANLDGRPIIAWKPSTSGSMNKSKNIHKYWRILMSEDHMSGEWFALWNYPTKWYDICYRIHVKIGTISTIFKYSNSSVQGNPTIFIESTIHAREWVTVATATYFLNELLTSEDPDIIDLAQNYDWVIIPVLNVDGYAYTHNRVYQCEKVNQWSLNYLLYFVGSHVAQKSFAVFHPFL